MLPAPQAPHRPVDAPQQFGAQSPSASHGIASHAPVDGLQVPTRHPLFKDEQSVGVPAQLPAAH